jgi:hypothetical protein
LTISTGTGVSVRPIILILAAIGMGACTKVEPPPPEPTPTPRPPPATPHPATGATERAIRLYPDLAVKGSLFNRTFLEVFEQENKLNPTSLVAVDWPIYLAHRTGVMLGVKPVPDTTPPPQVQVIYADTPKPGTMLDQPAKRSSYYSRGTPQYRRVYQQTPYPQ